MDVLIRNLANVPDLRGSLLENKLLIVIKKKKILLYFVSYGNYKIKGVMQMSLLCPFFFKTKTNAILVNSNNTLGMTSGREPFATQIRSKPC